MLSGWKLEKLPKLIGPEGILCDGDWIETKDQDVNGEVRLIQLSDIGDGYFLNKSKRFLTRKRAIELNCTFLKYGDILIARMPDPLGRCCVFPYTDINKYVTAVDVCILRPELTKIDRKFIAYIINSPSIRASINSLQSGTTRKRISKKNLCTIDFPVPSLIEQQQIVSKIEELFSELDKGKQQLETVKHQLKTYRQAVLKWAFEGRFTNKNIKDGQLPEGWKWVKTGEVIETIFNGYTPKSEFLTQKVGEIPFIKVYNLKFDGTLNFEKDPTFIPRSIHEKELKRSRCHPNDVLINIVGPPLGKVSVVPKKFKESNINQAIVLFRPNGRILSKFISFFLQNPTTINWLEDTSKATAGQWNVKVSTCRIIPIPLPPISDQEQIILEIETRLSVCDKMEKTIENSLWQIESLRQSVLKQAFEGKLL